MEIKVIDYKETAENLRKTLLSYVDCVQALQLENEKLKQKIKNMESYYKILKKLYDNLLENSKIISNALRKYQSDDIINVVRCKDCKHKPKHPPGYDYGHYLEFPDDICPCQCADPWHSMKPEDNFFCAKGERKSENG